MEITTIAELMVRLRRVQQDLVLVQREYVGWNGTQSAGAVKVASEGVKALKGKFEKIQDSFDQIASEEEAITHEPTFTTIATSLMNLMVGIEDVKEARLQVKEKNHVFKFDKLKLPSFSGDFSEWQEFSDLFKAAIHNNGNIAGGAKMVYLKEALKGDAATIVANTPSTAAGYEEAWKKVEARYSNQREIVFSHLRKFYKLQRQQDTSTGLRKLCDTVNECVRSLYQLQIEVDKWDVILVFLALHKVDEETKKQWLLTQGNQLPILSELLEYLEKRATALSDKSSSGKSNTKTNPESKKSSSHASTSDSKSIHTTSGSGSQTKSKPISCAACGDDHLLFRCPSFQKCTIKERVNFVKKNDMCQNCFSSKHNNTKNPAECPSKFSCKLCGERHHSLLHLNKSSAPPSNTTAMGSSQDEPSSSFCGFGSTSSCHVLLETALVSVTNSQGIKKTVRVFVDKGSEEEFISEKCVSFLGLEPYGTSVKVSGLGGVDCGSSKGKVKLTLISNHSDFQLPICPEVIPKVTPGNLPQCKGQAIFPHLRGLKLADPQFYRPQPVDILLSARYASLIKTGGLIHGPPGTPCAEETLFGWLLSGTIPSATQSVSSHNSSVSSSHAATQNSNLDEDPDSLLQYSLQKFWESEEPEPHSAPRTKEDAFCESFYSTTTTRDPEGRIVVTLPFRPNHPTLHESFPVALRRFHSVEKRMIRDPSLKEFYSSSFRKNLESGIMELIPPTEIKCDAATSYYMPYSEVVKPSSTTTKVRIVFDCSAETVKKGPSLNQIMCPGPKLQVDLMPLLIKFRTYPYALSADITKFFLQFPVTRIHQDFQRLLFRENPDEPIQHFRMKRITFGVTAAPYLAIRSLHKLFDEECDEDRVTQVVKEETLVDNVLTGSFSLPEALHIQSKLIEVMAKGKLELRKWSSNAPELLNSVPEEDREVSLPITIQDFQGLPTLGYQWNPSSDSFSVAIPTPLPNVIPSKRAVLSQIARLYDPSGWLSPVTIRAKLLLQKIWKEKLDWDTPLPSPLSHEWNKIVSDLPLLQEFNIRRCYSQLPSTDEPLTYHVIGFSDASNAAFAAVVYVRSFDSSNSNIQVTLVGSKSKVAPVKGETTPRLELNGARLLSRFVKTVVETLPVPVAAVYCYSDSMSVLGQLNPNYKEKRDVFVVNRVRTIHQNLPNGQWGHVKGTENPADCASRGITAKDFLSHPLWLQGPPWLKSPDFPPPAVETFTASIQRTDPPNYLYQSIMRTSSLPKMKRVVAQLSRLTSFLNTKIKVSGPPTAAELDSALLTIVAAVQKETFPEILHQLSLTIPNLNRKIRFLAPFLDKDGLIRVGGRIGRSKLPFGQKHPLLLPKNHHFSQVVARYYHQLNLHAGPTLLLCLIRERFWIYGGPVLVKKIVRTCVICHKSNPKPLLQLMSELPEARVTLSRPFTNTGMDFAGPFTLCVIPGRNPRLTKSYFCIFVCMATKAAHLELVGDLSTPAFLAALKRFTSRRGLPSALYCDGGKNFVGAKNEVERVVSFLNSTDTKDAINNYAAEMGINFRFNTPLAPHQGGLWEAAVKSTKYHLHRIIGNRHLSHEEFGTLLVQVEAALNSRPITPMSSDPSDCQALTPAHFLIGSPLHSVPEEDLTDRKEYSLSRWQQGQRIFQEFWTRFHKEYLQTLQSRPKWLIQQPDVTPGTLVLVKESDEAFSSHKWNLARVTQVFPGADGRVRVAEIKTSSGSILRRPIVKLAPLPLQ